MGLTGKIEGAGGIVLEGVLVRGVVRAKHLADAGAKVVISSRKADACEKVAESINGSGGEAIAVPASISDKSQLQNLVDETHKKWGHVDILVCNAASNPYYGPMKDMPDDAFEKVLGVNILSNHWLAQMVLPEMVERRDGVVMIISSVGGLRGSDSLGAYCISKAADVQLVRNLAVEYGPHNIRVNAISPGLVRTDFARALWENPEILKQRTSGDPLRRIGEPHEIAGSAVYLASAAGSFTTGQNIVVDGGSTIT